MNPVPDWGYGTMAVARAVGVTHRNLDYWARTGLVGPSLLSAAGSGSRRLYSFQDMIMLRTVKKLLDAGISLQQIRKTVEYLQEMKQPLESVTLMSDGVRVYAPTSADGVLDLLAKGNAVFAIDVGKVISDLAGAMEATRKVGV